MSLTISITTRSRVLICEPESSGCAADAGLRCRCCLRDPPFAHSCRPDLMRIRAIAELLACQVKFGHTLAQHAPLTPLLVRRGVTRLALGIKAKKLVIAGTWFGSPAVDAVVG